MIFQVTLSQPISFSFLSVSSFCLFQVLIFALLPVGEKWINIREDIILLKWQLFQQCDNYNVESSLTWYQAWSES